MSDATRCFPTPLAAALAAVSFAVAAAPAHADELANLINAWRAASGTCDGRPAAPVGRLAVEPALSRIRIGPGTFLESALQDAGYAAAHAEAITVSGPPDARAALEAIGQPYCRTLRAAEFAAIGTAHVGAEWQVVLARPVVIPPLPDWPVVGQDILALVNAARARPRTCGTQAFGPAGPLAWNPLLGRAALAHSTDMAQKHYFNHEQPDGSLPADRATAAGYRWVRVGENIASGQRTPEEAVASWLGSPGHCANIMNPAFTEMGAAYAINPRNRNRTAYWTQVFGTPL
jgi:uncharacterized protein YkwD